MMNKKPNKLHAGSKSMSLPENLKSAGKAKTSGGGMGFPTSRLKKSKKSY